MKAAGKTNAMAVLSRWGKPAAPVLIYLALLALHWRVAPYADDLWYAEAASGQNFFALQLNYYLTWSGRVISNALAFFLMNGLFLLWKLLNPAMLMALAWGLARLAAPRVSFRGFVLALLLVFVLGPGVADYSIFWATGSLYYLWPTVAAVFLLQPYADLARALGPLKGRLAPDAVPPLTKLPLRLALAVPACLGNELLTLCVLGFMALILAETMWRVRAAGGKSRLWLHYAWLPVAAAACAAVLFFAPGSASRFAHEARVYRDEYGILFTSLPLGEKLSGGLAWMFDMLLTALFPLLLMALALAWAARYRPGWLGMNATGVGQKVGATAKTKWPYGQYLFFALPAFSAALAFPARADALFAFAPLAQAAQRGLGGLFAALLPYGYWALLLAVLLVLLGWHSRYAALAVLAGLCTGLAMIFSPTIYFSGERTMFTAGMLLIVLVLAFFRRRVPLLVLLAVGGLAATGIMRLVSRLALFAG